MKSLSTSDHFPFLAWLEVLPEWDAAADRFLEAGGAVMVLGGPDTGKSTLCRYLVYRSFVAGEPVALIDLDVGQSHLGPPTTLGLGLSPPRRPGDEGLFPEGLYFIGQTSPMGAILEITVGCRVLADLSASRGITRVVVNTSGLIQGPGALRLKRSQVELLNPSLILALQRQQELEPLLRGLGGAGLELPLDFSQKSPHPSAAGGQGEGDVKEYEKITTPTPTLPPQGGGRKRVETSCLQKKYFPNNDTDGEVGTGSPCPPENPSSPLLPPGGEYKNSGWPILRLPVSSRVTRRSPEERRLYREERFRRYFHRARRLTLPWRSLVWEGLPWGQGEPVSPEVRQHLNRSLGVEVLHGEVRGRRLVLLLAELPREPRHPGLPAPAEWEQVHYMSWPALHWRLVGLLDARHRTLALGLILPNSWDPETLALWTPLAPGELTGVRFVKAGKMKVSLRGQEISHV